MATWGSGSGLSAATRDLNDTANGDRHSIDTYTSEDKAAGLFKRRLWTSIKQKADFLWRKNKGDPKFFSF
ncbi:MAG: hypothetical protein Q9169_006404 [Polycauliona sp. 2 TL-2023]